MLAEAANSTADKAQIISALKQASAATGSDFHYLLGTAMRESSLKPQAQSSTSSACGLFQFTGQTWMGMIKQTGAKYGLGSYANAISQDGDGHFRADNAADRQAILALRKDPKVAALMAGEFAKSSSDSGRDVEGFYDNSLWESRQRDGELPHGGLGAHPDLAGTTHAENLGVPHGRGRRPKLLDLAMAEDVMPEVGLLVCRARSFEPVVDHGSMMTEGADQSAAAVCFMTSEPSFA